MSMSEDIRQKVQEIVRMVMGDEDIIVEDELNAGEVEAWDSMNHVNLMITVESEFEIRFSDDEIAELQNIGELIALIKLKVS